MTDADRTGLFLCENAVKRKPAKPVNTGFFDIILC